MTPLAQNRQTSDGQAYRHDLESDIVCETMMTGMLIDDEEEENGEGQDAEAAAHLLLLQPRLQDLQLLLQRGHHGLQLSHRVAGAAAGVRLSEGRLQRLLGLDQVQLEGEGARAGRARGDG